MIGAVQALSRLPGGLPASLGVPFAAEGWHPERLALAVAVLAAAALGAAAGVISLRLHAERRRSAERARQAEARHQARYRAVFESTRDFIYTHDLEGQILNVNPAAEEVTGYPARELLGMNFLELVAPEDGERFRALLAAARQGKPPSAIEIRIRRADGEIRFLEARLRLSHSGGLPAELEGIARDNTEPVRIREALERARAAAEYATRAKCEFLANVSHEIRTPINGTLGMLELALSTPAAGELREYLAMARQSAGHLQRLIEDVLDFSRLEAGQFRLAGELFDLHETIRTALAAVAEQAREKRLKLVCRVAPEVPARLVGDAARLRQVLGKLLSNAVKFTEQGEVSLEVALAPGAGQEGGDDAAVLQFAVCDTGIGIPREKLHSIFEPFHQAEGSLRRRHGGAGLGLAICAELVQRMGGRLWAESGAGRGSRFLFTVRLERPGREPQAAGFEGWRVLVADGRETSRAALAGMLEEAGCRTRTAETADAALEKFQEAARLKQPFQVVLLDWSLPGARHLLARIRSVPAPPAVIAVTSKPFADDRAGIGALLAEPVQPAGLARALREVLPQAAATPAAPPADPPPRMAPGRRSGARILVAEDNQVNQLLARRVLEKGGYRVSIVPNGREALEALRRERFDCVLMDVQMPEMDGLEASLAIRRLEEAAASRGVPGPGEPPLAHPARIPIIAVTAHALRGDRERCLAAGMDDYVAKPVTAESLYGAVERALAGDGQACSCYPA